MKREIVAAVSLLAASGIVSAADISIDVKTDGLGSLGAVPLFTGATATDWHESGAGNAETQGPFGSVPNLGVPYTFRYQSTLTGLTGGTGFQNGTPDDDPTGGGGFTSGTAWELTVVAEFQQIAALGGPTTVINTIIPGSGTFHYYLDGPGILGAGAGARADLAAGVGFEDGVEILSGTIQSGGSAFTAISGTTGVGAANLAFDVSDIQINTDYINPSNPASILNGFTFISNQNFPPGTSDTALWFQDAGGFAAFTSTVDDLVLKVDGSSTYQHNVPVPASILLLGAGLLGMGGFARRRTQS